MSRSSSEANRGRSRAVGGSLGGTRARLDAVISTTVISVALALGTLALLGGVTRTAWANDSTRVQEHWSKARAVPLRAFTTDYSNWIDGSVFDSQGLPVSGARVSLFDSGAVSESIGSRLPSRWQPLEPELTVRSDDAGRFRLLGASYGAKVLVVTKDHYQSSSKADVIVVPGYGAGDQVVILHAAAEFDLRLIHEGVDDPVLLLPNSVSGTPLALAPNPEGAPATIALDGGPWLAEGRIRAILDDSWLIESVVHDSPGRARGRTIVPASREAAARLLGLEIAGRLAWLVLGSGVGWPGAEWSRPVPVRVRRWGSAGMNVGGSVGSDPVAISLGIRQDPPSAGESEREDWRSGELRIKTDSPHTRVVLMGVDGRAVAARTDQYGEAWFHAPEGPVVAIAYPTIEAPGLDVAGSVVQGGGSASISLRSRAANHRKGGAVFGFVQTELGAPAQGARVAVRRVGERARTCSSDENGFYVLTDLVAGRYQIGVGNPDGDPSSWKFRNLVVSELERAESDPFASRLDLVISD